MSAAAWIALVSLAFNVVLMALVVWALDLRDQAEQHIRNLAEQCDELRRDYGSQIAQSRRMALRVVDGAAGDAAWRR